MTQTSHQWIVGHTFAASFERAATLAEEFSFWGTLCFLRIGHPGMSYDKNWKVRYLSSSSNATSVGLVDMAKGSLWVFWGEWACVCASGWLDSMSLRSAFDGQPCLQSKPSVTSRLYLFQGNQSLYLLKHVSNNRTGFHATSCKFSEVSCLSS